MSQPRLAYNPAPRIALRDYQRASIDALYAYLRAEDGNGLIVLPTGSGKSLVLAEIVRDACTSWPGTRILILAHVKELLTQNASELVRHYPDVDLGIYSAGLRSRDMHNAVLIASIQSVYRRGFDLGRFDLILVDEAHLIPRSDSTMYQKFLADAKLMNPAVRVVGLTATDYRLDSGRLTEGKDAFFHRVVHEVSIRDLIQQGYLCRVTTRRTTTQLDVTGVHTRGGEFIPGELAAAVDLEGITKAAVSEIVAAGADRAAWLVFCSSVAHAGHVADELRARGVTAGVVVGETPAAERDQLIMDFKNGKIRALCNMNVLTTGFNVPAVDLLAVLRPTKSPGLYVQMIGRGTRNAPGKTDCIAEGQLVLTNCGLVPIEQVTKTMLLWDGACFVGHDGAILRGEKEVITYAGLTATPDHKVWTEQGWQTLGWCASQQIAIRVTGDGRRAIREADGHVRRNNPKGSQRISVSKNRLHHLWKRITQGVQQFVGREGGVPKVRNPPEDTKMAFDESHRSTATMHQSAQCRMEPLWGERHSIQLPVPNSDGSVDSRTPWSVQGQGNRQDRQRRPLRAQQSQVGYQKTEHVEHTRSAGQRQDAFLPHGTPGNSIRRRHLGGVLPEGDDLTRNRGTILPTFLQTKRRVWDILNAGPHHRFTVSGLLVSNCVVLDFGGNIERFGPIDALAVQPGKRKGDAEPGEAPVKACPQCQAYCLIAMTECPECGFKFPPPLPKVVPVGSRAAILSDEQEPQWADCTFVTYSAHAKPDKPVSLRVDYRCRFKRYSEWVCLEHQGFARQKAGFWWRTRALPGSAVPATVAEALERQHELRSVEAIHVVKEGKFDRVLGARFGAGAPVADRPGVPFMRREPVWMGAPPPEDDIPF